MPGKVIEMRVGAGETVSTGQLLLTLEAMKMEHPVIASSDGVVTEVRVAPGEQVAAGQVLLVIEASEEAHAHGG
jgi:biotin carboxyl carrier protein